MSAWYTAAQLAGAPGLPSTERAVRTRAQANGWKCRTRTAVGGGREYALQSLPEETRRHFALQAAQAFAETPAQAVL